MQHRKKLRQAQANGTKPFDIEQQAPGGVPTSELNASQATISAPNIAGDKVSSGHSFLNPWKLMGERFSKDFEDVKDYVSP